MARDQEQKEVTGGTLKFVLDRMDTPFWRAHKWAIDRLTEKGNKRKPLVFDVPRA